MSEMIERVARQLAARRVYDGYNAETRARMIEREMYGAIRDVRIVLTALLEPTNEMQNAAVDASDLWADEGETNAIWRAMISAALAEGDA